MSLKDQVTADLKEAMRAKDEVRLDAIRGIRGEIIKFEKSGKGEITDQDILKLIKTLIKERREAVEYAKKADRADLCEAEEARIAVLQTYLPPALSTEELQKIVDDAVAASGAASVKDMGRVMGVAQKAIRETGKDADNRQLSELIKQKLS